MPIQVFDVDQGRTFKVRDMSFPDVDDGGAVLVRQYTLEPSQDGTLVTLDEGTWKPELTVAVNRWLDDLPGDELEHIAAELEQRRNFSMTSRGWEGRLYDVA